MNQDGYSTSAIPRHSARTKFNLNLAVRDLVHLRQHDLHHHKIAVILDLDAELPGTTADSQQIECVLLALLARSRQAIVETQTHGTITVRTRVKDGKIQFSITDDGRVFFKPQESINMITCAEIVQDQAGELYAWRQRRRATTTIIMDLPV